MLTGGCFCGAIRYQTSGQVFNQTNCHCEICRRTSGAPCMAWFSVPAAGFRLVLGAPAKFRSRVHATRTFCPTCGTQLTFADDSSPDAIDVSTCSLDDPVAAAPRDHTYTASQLGWMRLADELPRFSRSRFEG